MAKGMHSNMRAFNQLLKEFLIFFYAEFHIKFNGWVYEGSTTSVICKLFEVRGQENLTPLEIAKIFRKPNVML